METLLLLLATLASAALIGFAWYAAKRDLTSASVRAHGPQIDELRALQQSVGGLIEAMDHKAAEIERRMQAHFDRIAALETRFGDGPTPAMEAPREENSQAEPIPVPDAPHDARIEPSRIDRALDLVERGADVNAAARAAEISVSEVETAIRIRQMRLPKA